MAQLMVLIVVALVPTKIEFWGLFLFISCLGHKIFEPSCIILALGVVPYHFFTIVKISIRGEHALPGIVERNKTEGLDF